MRGVEKNYEDINNLQNKAARARFLRPVTHLQPRPQKTRPGYMDLIMRKLQSTPIPPPHLFPDAVHSE